MCCCILGILFTVVYMREFNSRSSVWSAQVRSSVYDDSAKYGHDGSQSVRVHIAAVHGTGGTRKAVGLAGQFKQRQRQKRVSSRSTGILRTLRSAL